MMEKSSVYKQVLATLSASLTSLCAGYHIGWPSPMLVKLQAEDSSLPVTSVQGAWITSTLYVGIIVGAFIARGTVNRFGRKLPLLLIAISYAVSCICIIAAQNYWWLIVSRFISGTNSGIRSTIVPMYLAEIAEPRVRGMFGVINNQMMYFGILLAYCIGPWVDYMVLGEIGLVMPVVFGLTFIWMPESPYYLLMKMRTEDAEKSLIWLRGTRDVKEELTRIGENIENDRRNTGTIKELVKSSGNRKALVITTIIILAPQLSGIGAIRAYTGLIFEASGSDFSASISIIIVGMIQFISGMLGIFTVDLLGRRPLMLFSVSSAAVFLIGEALYFQLLGNGYDVSGLSWLPVTAMVGYLICFSIGLGPLPYLILSELFSCNVKAIAGMYAVLLTSLSGLAVTRLYQIIADAWGIQYPFWVFVGCSIVFTVLIYFLLPETKKKSLEEIQDLLRGSADSSPNVRYHVPEYSLPNS